MALLLRRTPLRALLRRGSTWSRSTEPNAPPAFLTSLDNPQTYFDSSELRAVGGLETQPQALSAETEKVLHDEAWRGVAKKRGLMLESLVDADVATHGASRPRQSCGRATPDPPLSLRRAAHRCHASLRCKKKPVVTVASSFGAAPARSERLPGSRCGSRCGRAR